MGITCSVLVNEGSKISATDLYSVLQKVCSYENLIIDINTQETDNVGKIKVIRTNISEQPLDINSSNQLCVDIFDEPYKFKCNSFEWFDESVSFFEMIVIDYFDNNEYLLFKVVHSILKVYPQAKLWIEEEWFYTIDDLDKISNRQFNNEWCYMNPSSV